MGQGISLTLTPGSHVLRLAQTRGPVVVVLAARVVHAHIAARVVRCKAMWVTRQRLHRDSWYTNTTHISIIPFSQHTVTPGTSDFAMDY